jgi:hypothetical protein
MILKIIPRSIRATINARYENAQSERAQNRAIASGA